MTTCKNCKTEVLEEITVCNICNYPLKGTDKEKSVFVARQIMQKGDVEDSVERLKKARIILFIIGAFNIIVPFIPIFKIDSDIAIVLSIVVGFLFVILGILSFKHPIMSLSISLGAVIFYYLLIFVTNPILIFKGLIWKVVTVLILGYGLYSAAKASKIIRENKYLASVIEKEKKESK